jgi:hypothetical protein
MKSPEQVTDDVMGSSVATQVVDAVRHAVFAGALALPMALLADARAFITRSRCQWRQAKACPTFRHDRLKPVLRFMAGTQCVQTASGQALKHGISPLHKGFRCRGH